MAKNIIGIPEAETRKIINRIQGNIQFLDFDDLKVLEFLSTKGLFEKRKPKLVPRK